MHCLCIASADHNTDTVYSLQAIPYTQLAQKLMPQQVYGNNERRIFTLVKFILSNNIGNNDCGLVTGIKVS